MDWCRGRIIHKTSYVMWWGLTFRKDIDYSNRNSNKWWIFRLEETMVPLDFAGLDLHGQIQIHSCRIDCRGFDSVDTRLAWVQEGQCQYSAVEEGWISLSTGRSMWIHSCGGGIIDKVSGGKVSIHDISCVMLLLVIKQIGTIWLQLASLCTHFPHRGQSLAISDSGTMAVHSANMFSHIDWV